MLTSRSMNSYMRSPRSVTMAPIGIPSRTLKAAMDFLALVITGFCPVIWPRSLASGSMILRFCVASPTPMFTTILCRRGTAMGFAMPSSLASAGAISLLNFSFSLATTFAAMSVSLPFSRFPVLRVREMFLLFIQRRFTTAANAQPFGALMFMADARRPATGADNHHIGNRNARFLLRDAALDVALRVGADVLLHHHDVLHQNFALGGKNAQYTSLLASVATGDHLHLVITLDISSYMHFSTFSNVAAGPRLRPSDGSLTAPRAPATQSSKTFFRVAHGPPARKRVSPPAPRYH